MNREPQITPLEDEPIPSEEGTTVLYYEDEKKRPILFGFFVFPEDFDIAAEIEAFRREQPVGMSLGNWLVYRGAQNVAALDAYYRDRAQASAAVKTFINYKGEEEEDSPARRIVLDLDSLEATPYLLER